MARKELYDSWERLKNWYEIHQPFVLSAFNDACTQDDIDTLEEEIGVTFPLQLKELLLLNNGTDGFVLFDGQEVCRLLSVNEIKAEFQMQQMSNQEHAEIAQKLNIPYDPQRIPTLLYPSGELAYVMPKTGELSYIAYDGDGYANFKSLATFNQQLVDGLEKGRYQLDEIGNIRRVIVDEIWQNIQKFLDDALAHYGDFFQKGISEKNKEKLEKVIQENFPSFSDFDYADLPQSLRETLQIADGQSSDFELFFLQGKSYCLLSSSEMIAELKKYKASDKLFLPLLRNAQNTIGIDISSETLYLNQKESIDLDWMDYLLTYWDQLQKRRFKVEDNRLIAK